jgi:hypothetical protein
MQEVTYIYIKGMYKSGTSMYCMVAILLILRHCMGIYELSAFVDGNEVLHHWHVMSATFDAHGFGWFGGSDILRSRCPPLISERIQIQILDFLGFRWDDSSSEKQKNLGFLW